MKESPKVVYKYRDWENEYHRRILTANELYFASPRLFNDPFDCRVGQNFSLLTAKEADDYVVNLAVSKFEQSQRDHLDFAFLLKDFEKRFADREKFQKQADMLQFKIQDDSYGVFSCSRRWNSILMWSHYSANHTGICIGLSWEKMMSLMDKRMVGKAGDVSYVVDFPPIKPSVASHEKEIMKRSFIETHSKAKEWEYEEEYRFMKTDPDGLAEEERIINVPDDFFVEVILGIAIPDRTKEEVLQICGSKGVPVYQAQKVKFKFEIDKVRI